MSGSLVEFLLERIAEDEAAARAASPGPWEHWGPVLRGRSGAMEVRLVRSLPVYQVGEFDDEVVTALDREDADHIARHDPARVLADREAKRRIVKLHHEYLGVCTHCVQVLNEHQRETWPCATLRLLALPFADHADYDERWRP